MNRTRAYGLCQIAGWGGLLLLNLVPNLVAGGLTWPTAAYVGALAGLGFAASHLVRALALRGRWAALPVGPLALRVVPLVVALGALVSAALTALWAFALAPALGPEGAAAPGVLRTMFVTNGGNAAVYLLGWSLIYFGAHLLVRLERAEVDRWRTEVSLREARLRVLEAQLNPHFLFNALNSVRALVVADPAEAQRAVTLLARLLRRTLEASDEVTHPLRDELDVVRTYLEIERVRFGDRLRFSVEADAGLADREVPALLVQTLVENAVKHGVARDPAPGTVEVRVTGEPDDGGLCVRVVNSGRLERASRPGGYGLENARERLDLLYGRHASLDLREGPPGCVVAEVRLPEPSVSTAHVARRPLSAQTAL